MRKSLITAVIAAALVVPTASAADATVKPRVYKNCTALNKVYKHGVAKKKGVKDKVRGRTKPVTTYAVNAKVYQLNWRKLDRDRDGIVCEKR